MAESGHLLLKDTAGKLVAEAPAPMMWDSSKDHMSGEPEHQARVGTEVETAGTGTDPRRHPGRRLPHEERADVPRHRRSDHHPRRDHGHLGRHQLHRLAGLLGGAEVGFVRRGATKARSYIKFDVAPFKGKHITDTNLALYSYYSSTCDTTGAGTEVRRITGTWTSADITWAVQPATTTTGAVINKAALGYSSSCPAGTVNFDIDAIVQAWADGVTNQGLRIAGASETDSTTWRRYRSANYVSGDGSTEPHLTVTYNSYPSVPSSTAIAPSQVNSYNDKRYVTSLTPTLSSKVTDADGANAQAQYEITADPAYADTTYAYTAYGKTVASGSTSTLAVPSASAFPSGGHLRYRVRAYDGTDFGAWSGYTTFVLNTAKPTAPTVACDTYTQNGWTAKASAAVNCTLDTASTDGAGFQWGLDDASMPTKKLDTGDGSGGDAQTVSINPANGWHTLYARTIDSGGNLSTATTAYSFGVGADGAAVLSPADGDTTARRLNLSAKGLTSYTGVTWQYRRGETDSWHTVPVGDVTAAGTTVSAWPVAVNSGAATKVVWNTISSLSEDGVIQLRAAFTNGATTGYSQTVGVTLDRDAGIAPSAQVGPGQVNQLTGDYTLSATDASAFGAGVGRTYSSRANSTNTEGQAQIFGSAWTSSVDAAGSDYTQLRKTSDASVELLSADGSSVAFTATTGGGWEPETGAKSLSLTGSLTGTTFTLKSDAADVTVFTKAATNTATWTLASSATAVDDTNVTVASETVTVGGKTLGRPKYVVSPTGAVPAATCQATPATKGCRVLEYVYATATTATASTLGNYAGQVTSVKLWATTPAASASTAETIASYAYNASGQLRQVWDPRVSPALKTEYTYDTDGRVATLGQPGQLPWTFTYGKAGSALTAGAGMLLKATRAALAQGSDSTTSGSAVTTVVYDVPLSGPTAPHQMDAATVAAWAQDEAPTDATSVFPAGTVPASNTGGDLTSSAYGRAAITYINGNGQEVNSASPGGSITATEYGETGNIVAELTAANRELALSGSSSVELATLGLTDLSTAERAQLLSTVSEYSSDGEFLTDEYGPLHEITLTKELKGATAESTLAAGAVIPARAHTSYAYDENRPSDAEVSGLVTSTASGAAIAGYASDADTDTSTTTYDWSTGQELSTGGAESSSVVTVYDNAGQVASTRTAGSSGSDAGTLRYTYYDAAATGACASVEWDGMLCRITPAAAVTGGGNNPAESVTTVYTYDRWGQIATQTETANGATRTAVNTVDTVGRTTKTAVNSTTGKATPPITYTYDGTSGQLAAQTSNGQTVTFGYDGLGRQTSYNDGTGSTTTSAYDVLDRVVKVSDSVPSTSTYAYDGATGRVLSVTDSVAGTSTATAYDADGALTGESLPGGYTLATTFDTVGNQTSVTYRNSAGVVVLSDAASFTIHDKQVSHTQTDGSTTQADYTYDGRGRLTQAADTTANGCTTRAYTFDANSNRKALTTSSDDCDSSTADTTTATSSYTYDTVDRLVNSGYAYDAFGRTTTSAGTSLTYYTNDLVASETLGTSRKTLGLDAVGRLASSTTETTSDSGATWSATSTTVNHYSCGCDTTSWAVTTEAAGSASTVKRNVSDLFGGLAATTSATGDAVLQLSNLHGDISVQLDLETATAEVQRYDEYGAPLDATAASAEYGSLGSYQRATDGLAGYTLMGVRVYDPSTGRFLQADPVYGGNANAYVYPSDPVTQLDTSGSRLNYRDQQKATKNYTLYLRRSCTGHSKCSLAWRLKLKSIWKKYGSVKLVFSITIPGRRLFSNQNYGHAEAGDYFFHGSWGVPNGRGRSESERGKYSVLGFTRWFDWTDNVEWSGTVTVQNICVRNPRLSVWALFT
ncbi:DNRLRE domain-containing protein [Streptomyces sp. RKAG290]|uniref:DNRLRE domain-containing protein n=1 Tax=Streptomyces sp. RKAG290 TaxID=2888348 RepID=UPI0020343CC7|nr:DNRLRE domain-containing protein [Streptomyces sp. RKAG290]MCM2411285.1 DNRLRE domain-containing protein [Streptomyces sp. RKAG290]